MQVIICYVLDGYLIISSKHGAVRSLDLASSLIFPLLHPYHPVLLSTLLILGDYYLSLLFPPLDLVVYPASRSSTPPSLCLMLSSTMRSLIDGGVGTRFEPLTT